MKEQVIIEIEEERLKALFDLSVRSMDFASGFLCEEDVVILRDIAVILGLDPMVGTPDEHGCRYGAPHTYNGWSGHNARTAEGFEYTWCRYCGDSLVLPTSDPIPVLLSHFKAK